MVIVKDDLFGEFSAMPKYRDQALINKVIRRIKDLREARGLTLQEFYNDTGVHLARIESTKRDLSISNIARICKYFGITLSDFFKGI